MDDRLRNQFQVASQAAHDGDFNRAASLFEQAFAEALESTSDERAVKTALAFHCGYCLLKAHGILDVHLRQLTSQQLEVALRARTFWLENMRLYSTLDSRSAALVEENLASGARAAVLDAPLMRGEHLAYQAHQLAPGGEQTTDKEGAVALFDEALTLLDPRIPDHQNLIRLAHRRLAVLCNDTGRSEEAIQHAKWVLANETDLDSTSRMMMQVLAGQTSSEVLSSSRCFVATVAFGSPTSIEVSVLRAFRDQRLRSGSTGRMCIALYERLSPPVSRFVGAHVILRKIVHLALLPVVAMTRLVVHGAPSSGRT